MNYMAACRSIDKDMFSGEVISVDRVCSCMSVFFFHYINVQRRRKEFKSGGRGGGQSSMFIMAGERCPSPSQLGECCKLPHWGLGLCPRSQRYLHLTTLQNYTRISAIHYKLRIYL